ncbi:GrdX family protein [Oscillibacter sp. GMB15532]|uniref:GrdX family protein n=1 Tax=Oscillibacter sp. GMB15532 TaxID=3230022 RepID=UPI0034DE532B
MTSERQYLILTNNPLVKACMAERYEILLSEELTLREILVKARDMVYAGHTLYTHPLAGSVKPNETPYKSVVVSKAPREFSVEQAGLIAGSIEVCDKLTPRRRTLTKSVLEDFQLIDYTLLSGALGFDAAAGLSNARK